MEVEVEEVWESEEDACACTGIQVAPGLLVASVLTQVLWSRPGFLHLGRLLFRRIALDLRFRFQCTF